jgi:anti-anti-sigma factor
VTVGDVLEIDSRGDVVVAQLSGEIDLSNARTIGAQTSAAMRNDAAGLVLDLTATTYLDSSGVHLVFDLAERLTSRQQRLVLVVPEGSRIRRVLDLVNVQAVVPVTTEQEQAVTAARGG